MDTKIIRHLMRGDFSLLKPPVIATWLLLALAALAALFASPGNFNSYPSTVGSWSSTGSGQEFAAGSVLEGDTVVQAISFLATPLYILASLILALTLGSSGIRWNATRPIKTSEIALSKLGSLLLFLTLPQAILITLVLAKNGFSAEHTALGVLSAAAVFFPLQLACLMFGAIHRSLGRSLVAALAIVASACLIGMFEPKALPRILGPLVDFWASQAGPQRWIYLGLCALGFALVLLFRGRFRTRWTPVAATAAVVAFSWFATRNLSSVQISDGGLFANETPAVTLGIGRLSEVEIQTNQSPRLASAGNPVVRISGKIPALDVPSGAHAFWQRSGASEIWQRGELVAEAVPVARRGKAHVAALVPKDNDAIDRALRKHLPPGLYITKRQHSGIRFSGRSPSDFGQFDLSSGTSPLDYSSTITLKAQLSGITYHYEVAADVAVSGEADFEYLGVRGRVRIVGEDNGLPAIDLLLRMPALGRSPHIEHSHPKLATDFWNYFVYLPASNQILRTKDVYGSNSKLFPGASVQRRMFILDTSRLKIEDGKTLDTSGARLLVVVPTIDSVVQKDAEFADVYLRPRYRGASDYYFTLTGTDHEALSFSQLMARRPDPQSATSESLGEWLELTYRRHLPLEHLSEYASEHLDFLLRVANSGVAPHSSVAITLGAAETDRDKIIARLKTRPDLIQVVAARDWIEEAREEILHLWDSGSASEELLKAVISLEEPRTYPQLLKMIARGDIRPHIYELVRRLPEIDQQKLDRAVSELFYGSVRDEWEPQFYKEAFEIPVRHGMREALVESFRLMKKSGGSPFNRAHCILIPDEIPPVEKEAHRWVGTLEPESLVWDPFIRRWKLNPENEEKTQ